MIDDLAHEHLEAVERLAWKLWLFPFALLLCLSLDRLLRRVAPDGRVPLLCLVLPTRKRPPEVPVLVG